MPPRRSLPQQFLVDPFAVGAARAVGVGEGRLRGGDLTRPFHGVRMSRTAEPLSVEERCRAYAVRMRPCEVFSHRTAAALHGLPLPFRDGGDLDVAAVTPHGLPRAAGVRGHRIQAGAPVVVVRGFRATSAVEAWCQLAPELTLRQLVAVGDGLVRRQRPLAVMSELRTAVSQHAGRRGHRRLVAALHSVRERTDSPAETDLRLDLMEFGLPEPEVNVDILDASGRRIAIGDLVYPGFRVLVEYDGGQHREDGVQYARDVDRLDDVARAGWRIIRFNRSHRGARRQERLARVREALARAGWSPDATAR